MDPETGERYPSEQARISASGVQTGREGRRGAGTDVGGATGAWDEPVHGGGRGAGRWTTDRPSWGGEVLSTAGVDPGETSAVPPGSEVPGAGAGSSAFERERMASPEWERVQSQGGDFGDYARNVQKWNRALPANRVQAKKEINQMHRDGRIDKDTWRAARRALYKSQAEAQQILDDATGGKEWFMMQPEN